MRIKSSLVSLSSVSPLGLLGLRCDSCVARCGHGLPVCLSLSPSSPPPKRRDLSGVADVIETLHVGVCMCMCMCKYVCVCVRSPIQTRCFQPDAWAQKRLMISSTRARIIINIEPSQRQPAWPDCCSRYAGAVVVASVSPTNDVAIMKGWRLRCASQLSLPITQSCLCYCDSSQQKP
jgi:hypothetical protein